MFTENTYCCVLRIEVGPDGLAVLLERHERYVVYKDGVLLMSKDAKVPVTDPKAFKKAVKDALQYIEDLP